jgi:hypothetical protein
MVVLYLYAISLILSTVGDSVWVDCDCGGGSHRLRHQAVGSVGYLHNALRLACESFSCFLALIVCVLCVSVGSNCLICWFNCVTNSHSSSKGALVIVLPIYFLGRKRYRRRAPQGIALKSWCLISVIVLCV